MGTFDNDPAVLQMAIIHWFKDLYGTPCRAKCNCPRCLAAAADKAVKPPPRKDEDE